MNVCELFIIAFTIGLESTLIYFIFPAVLFYLFGKENFLVSFDYEIILFIRLQLADNLLRFSFIEFNLLDIYMRWDEALRIVKLTHISEVMHTCP